MIWTDMVGIDPGGSPIPGYSLREPAALPVRARRPVRAEHPAVRRCPGPRSEWRDGVLWVGEIYGKALLGNLVLPSSVLMARTRLEHIRRFNPRLDIAWEDFDFFLRICRSPPDRLRQGADGLIPHRPRRPTERHPSRKSTVHRTKLRTPRSTRRSPATPAGVDVPAGRCSSPRVGPGRAFRRRRPAFRLAFACRPDATCASHFGSSSFVRRHFAPLALLPVSISHVRHRSSAASWSTHAEH